MLDYRYQAAFVAAGLCSFAATPLARKLAFRIGAVDRPGGRKIHSAPTPRAGGVAVYVGFVIAVLGVQFFRSGSIEAGQWRDLLPLLLSATAITVLGLIDDCCSLSSTVKLTVEILIAGANVAAGYSLDCFGSLLQVPMSLLWLVAIPNAVNLIDGLDGLASGIGLIASLTLLAVSIHIGAAGSAIVLAGLSGSLLGFLWYNSHPAEIFLGDSGSLLIGLVLALTTVQPQQSRTGVALLVSLVALGVPVTELTLTTLRRLLRAVRVAASGEPARYRFIFVAAPALFSPDRDHIHHRLLTFGLAQRKAVLVLYGISAALGCTAFVAKAQVGCEAVVILAGFGVITAINALGYRELRLLSNGLFLPIADRVANSSTALLVLYDVLIAAGALSAASWMCDGFAGFVWFDNAAYVSFLPLVGVQICALAAAGVYRRSYGTKTIGIPEVLALLKAALFAAVAGSTVAYSSAQNFGVPLIAIDAFVFGTLVVAIRLAFVTLDYIFRQEADVRSEAGAGCSLTENGISSDAERSQPVIGKPASIQESVL